MAINNTKMEDSTALKELRVFNITENGISMDGSGKVAVPACRIKASSYVEAAGKLSSFLKTRVLTEDIELITPIEKIDFE